MKKKKKMLLLISSISGVVAICGLFCCSCLGSNKKTQVASADVSQDLLISRYVVVETGYRVTSQINSDYSVWAGYAVDFRWYYNGANGYYLQYSMPAVANDSYSTSLVGYYYDSSFYKDMRNINPVAQERYLAGFYIDYQLSNDGTLLWSPTWKSVASSPGYAGMTGGYYTDNLNSVGTHGGEGIYWETPYKFVYCYLTKFNYLGMTGDGTQANFEVEYTYTMSRDDGSVYVFTNYFTALCSHAYIYNWDYVNGNGDFANPYASLISGYSNYDKISFNGNLLLWSHEFDLVDLPPSYADGYNTGYEDGYDSGYNAGRELNQQAYDNGFYEGQQSVLNQLDDKYTEGFNAGFNQGFVDSGQVTTIFSGILQVAMVPINFFLAIFNFEILGINISAFISALLTVAVTIIVVRVVVGKGGGSDG